MLKPALCCLSLLAASQAFACFTVTSPRGQVLYHAVDPPVDMSRQLHETLPYVFPGGHMVFDLGTDCPRAPLAPPGLPAVAPRQEGIVMRVLSGPGQFVAGDTTHQEVPTAALVADLGPQAGERASH